MNKEKTIKNMTKFFAEIYDMAIRSEAMDDKLLIELDDCCELECVIDSDLDSWIKELQRVDYLNQKVVEIAKEKPQLYETCRIFNRKLVMILDGMKNVMQKDLNITGWMRRNGKLEVIL